MRSRLACLSALGALTIGATLAGLMAAQTPASAQLLTCQSGSGVLTVNISGSTSSASPLDISASGPGNQPGSQYAFSGSGVTTTSCSGSEIPSGTAVAPSAGTIVLSQPANSTEQSDLLAFNGTAPVPNVTLGSGLTTVTAPGGFPGVAVGDTVTDVTNPSALPRGTLVLAVPTDTVTLSTQAPLAASNVPVQFEFALSGTVTGTSDALSFATPIVQPGMVVESDTAGCFAGSDIVTNTSWPVTSSSTTLTMQTATGGCSSPTLDSVTFGTTASVDSAGGSSELTGTADGSGGFPYVVPGMTATGDNLPGGTTVSQSPNSLVLSTAATCSAESDGLTFSNSVSGVQTTYDSTVVSVVSGGFPGVVPGMNVSSTGSGVSTGTFVNWVNGNEVGLSQPASANSTATVTFSTPNAIDAQLTSGVKSVLVANGGFPDVIPGMSVSGSCLSGATVSSVGSQSVSSVALTNAPTASNTYDLTFGASVLNVSVTDGSTTASAGNGASFPGVVPGMAVSGTFIIPGTTVAAVNGNSLTMSAAATGDNTGALGFSTAVPNVATTDGFPLISASSGSFSSVQPGMSVSGAFDISVDPKLVVTGQSGQPQYVIIDNENGYLASAAAGCDPQFRIQLPTGTSDTLSVLDDANTPASGDDNVGLTSSTSGPTEHVNVAEGACSTPDVAVPSGFALPAVNVEGGNGNDTLDLSGETTPSAVTIAGPTTTLPGQVTGLPGLTQTVTFSGFSSILGPQATTDFQPGTSTTSSIDFVGAPGQTNILDLSQQPGSGLLVAMDGDSPTNPGFFFGGPLSDQFSNVNQVLGGHAGTTTTFEAGPTSGVSFIAGASTASLQLPTSASQDVLDAAGSVTFFAGTDYFDGVSQFLGNPGSGGTDFVGQSSGGLEFLGQGAGGNELDLSAAPVSSTITVNGDSTGSLGTATGLNVGLGTSTEDTFANITNVVGSSLSSTSNPTVFNLSCRGGLTLNGHQGAALEVSSGSCAGYTPTVDASGGTLSGLPGGSDNFSGISTFIAPTSGDTTFVAPGNTGGLTFTGHGSGNSLDGSAMPAGANLNAASGTAQLTSKLSDVFSGISCFVGSSAGSTTFVAPAAGFSAVSPCVEYPSQPSVLGQGGGNTLDLSDLSGSPVTVDTVAQDVTAGASTPVTFAGIQRFTGPSSGNTTFLSGSTGGYTFTGQAIGNALSFGEVPSTGGVTVSLVPNGSGQDSAQPGSGTDLFSDIGDIDGSPGNDTFVDGPGSYVIAGGGGNDTFSAALAPSGLTLSQSAGTATATGGYAGTKTLTSVTTFVGSEAGGNGFATDGSGGYSFDAPGSTGNSLSFAAATATGVTIDVTSATGNGTAAGLSGPPTTDAFEGIQSFTGSNGGGTSFDVGNGAFDITGGTGGAPNSLSFGSATAGVTLDLVQGTAKGGPSGSVVNDTFSGIQDFKGSAAGGNDFVAAPAGGYAFDGAGTGNSLDLTSASSGTTVSENGGSGSVTGLSAPNSDVFTNIQDFVGPSSGGAFLPGCIGGAEFQSTSASVILELPSGCRQLTIDTTQSPGVISGLQGHTTDTFSGVSQFSASPSGGTTFVASGSTGGYSFDGAGTGNTFDASAFAAGATIDDSTAQATSGKVVDTFSNVACFVGSSSGNTTFIAPSSVAPDPTGCAGAAYNFSGQASGNVLDLSKIAVPVAIVLSSPTSGTVETASSTVYDNFSDIQTAEGAHQPSTTTIVSTTPSPVVGQPISVGVQVSGAFTGSVIPGPSGQVTVSDGTNSCKATLSGSGGVSVGSCSIIEQSPGSYSFSASYPGDGTFVASSTSAATTVGVTTASSATTITGTTSSPVVGEPVTIDVSVASQYQSAKAPAPTGLVTVSDGTNSCNINLVGSGGLSSGSCSIVETSIGTYSFTASYPGDGNFDTSHAPPSAVTVGESTTLTKITSVISKPVVGQPIVVDVSVAGQYHNAQAPFPTGAVTVNDGTQSCSATLAGSAGLSTGSCSIIETSPGVYHFTAAYSSDGNFLASKTWGVQFAVHKAPTHTHVSISGAPAIFGHEQSLRITVTVDPAYTGTPTGDVVVRAGSITVCKLSKVSGPASCNLSSSQFGPGHWKVTATYGGSPDFLASQSAPVGFTVKKATTSTHLSLSAASVGFGDEQAERITVTVKPQFAGTPTGLVELRSGKTVLCKVNLAKGGGSCTLSASELKKGSYSVTAVYTGSTDFLASSSPPAKLRVT